MQKDYTEAAKWYRKAADQGDADSQNSLALMYKEGEGVPKDVVEAYKWISLAIEGAGSDDHRTLYTFHSDGITKSMTPEQLAELKIKTLA